MKILFGAWPGYGHLLPMVPLIRAAQRAGHEVVVSSGSDMSALTDRLGMTNHRSGLTLADSYGRLPGRATISAMPAAEQAAFAARHFFGAGAVDRARDVLELFDRWRPDLVVHDTLELGSPTAALMRGVPHITHGYGPMVPRTSDFLAVIGSAISDMGLPDPVADVLAAPYLDICPPGLRGTELYPWSTTRPLRPSSGEIDSDAADLPDFTALPHPATVYVTLGTVMNQASDVFRAVIDGVTHHPVNAVVTTGPGFDAAQLGALPPGVFIAPFLPQAAVLPHCRAVVSHAGAGTMLGALCHGLPQLCLPQSTDQPFNTAALLPTGAGLALQPEEISADAVAEALGRLLDEPSFARAADRLRAEIAAMPPATEVLQELGGVPAE